MNKYGLLRGDFRFSLARFTLKGWLISLASLALKIRRRIDALQLPAKAALLHRFLRILLARLIDAAILKTSGFADLKRLLRLSWALFQNSLIVMGILPERAPNPFAGWRHDIQLVETPNETPPENKEGMGNSLVIKPAVDDSRYPTPTDLFSDLRFNGRF